MGADSVISCEARERERTEPRAVVGCDRRVSETGCGSSQSLHSLALITTIIIVAAGAADVLQLQLVAAVFVRLSVVLHSA